MIYVIAAVLAILFIFSRKAGPSTGGGEKPEGNQPEGNQPEGNLPEREGVEANYPITAIVKVVSHNCPEYELIWPEDTFEDSLAWKTATGGNPATRDSFYLHLVKSGVTTNLGEITRAFDDGFAKWIYSAPLLHLYNNAGDEIKSQVVLMPCIMPDGLRRGGRMK
jgi:hypothetical protein